MSSHLEHTRSEEAPAQAEPPSPVYRGPDRRQRPTPRFSRWSLRRGRRGRARRNVESEGSFVDIYSPRLLLVIMWVAFMNVCDSFFTLVHLQNGGTEVNPVAGLLLATGRPTFVLLKSAMITLALVVLCVHKNFHLARVGLWVAAIAYTVLLAYHLSLFGA